MDRCIRNVSTPVEKILGIFFRQRMGCEQTTKDGDPRIAECEEGVIETCVNYLCGLRLIRAIGNNDRRVTIFTVQRSVTMIAVLLSSHYNDL